MCHGNTGKLYEVTEKMVLQFKINNRQNKTKFASVVAVGKSKKQAKRNAAQAMIQRILQGGVTPQIQLDPAEEFDEETIPLVIASPLLTFWFTAGGPI